MHILPFTGSLSEVAADAIVVGAWAEGSSPALSALDQATGGAIERLLAAKEISTKRGDVTTLLAPSGVKALQAVVVGLGEKKDFDRGAAFRVAAAAAKALGGKPREKVVFALTEGWPAQQLESALCGLLVGCVGQDVYKAQKRLQPFKQALV